MRKSSQRLASFISTMVLLSSGLLFAAPPDLTQSHTVDRAMTYNLGATGLRGWIYTKAANSLDASQGRTTTASRQILVTHVGTNSPASGVMEVNDVILGIWDKPFSDDARKSFGRAITEAETSEKKGVLKLIRFRAGKTENVELKMKVMGSYSATAPYNCPKSALILADACKALEQEPLHDSLWGAVNGLALLATGKPEYLPRLQAFARSMVPKNIAMEGGDHCDSWGWGYKNVFLGEYYLATGDKEVLPGIKAFAVALARGQGMFGTYGHGGALKTADGKLHGSIPPYGPVNQAGLIANLGIVMGKKCGVADPEVDAAIGRSSKFFGYFVDKGAIPYGEHVAWPYHENNGKSALAAVLFSVQGNQPEAARFYAKMAAAAYANREYGHTGQGFSYLWGALGANMGGPAAAAAFVKEAQWHLDLVRRCDGSFTYDGNEQYGAGRTDDNTYYGKSSYCGLSPAATYVLTYSIPLKKLCITGKELKKSECLSAKEVTAVIDSGRFDVTRGQKTPQELVTAFSDWSPVVRGWAAEELAKRPEAATMVPALIKMAEGKDAHIRQAACEALGFIKDPAALPILVRLLKDDDRWLRVKAANALKSLGGAARPVLPEMLKAVVQNAEPIEPIGWEDPVQICQTELAIALFNDRGGLLHDSLQGVDRTLLYPAIRAVSKCPDGMGRFQLEKTLTQFLTLEDTQILAPDILDSIYNSSPADTMFVDSFRLAALQVLTKYRFKEGIATCVYYAKNQVGWQSESRTGKIMKELTAYGTAARDTIPELKALLETYRKSSFPKECNDQRIASLVEAIKTLENATTQPEMISFEKKGK